MTEIYHGPWSPTEGDIKRIVVKSDDYHPKYPTVTGETNYGYGGNQLIRVVVKTKQEGPNYGN